MRKNREVLREELEREYDERESAWFLEQFPDDIGDYIHSNTDEVADEITDFVLEPTDDTLKCLRRACRRLIDEAVDEVADAKRESWIERELDKRFGGSSEPEENQ